MTFKEELHYTRKRLYLTQAEMATLMGVTEQTIRRWEHGSTPRASAVRKLNGICAKNKIKLEKEIAHDFCNG